MNREHSFEHLRATERAARGCPWTPCNFATYRRCTRSGISRFDPTNEDRCGAKICKEAP